MWCVMKAALALAMLLAYLIIFGVLFVDLSEANPFIRRTPKATPPGTFPPELTVLIPKNFTTYPSGDLNVTFQVAKPKTSVSARFGALTVQRFLNGWSRSMKVFYYPSSEVEISTVLPNMYGDSNELVIQAFCTMEDLITGNLFSIEGNSTVYFTIENTRSLSSQSPSSEPTTPTSPTPMPHEVPAPSELEVILGVVFMVAIIGGSLGLMIYLIKRK